MSGLTDALLDWNLDLDDMLSQSEHDRHAHGAKESRRFTAPASLPSRRLSQSRIQANELGGHRVQFGSVQIRECERILGDNPACEVGPSLSLGWKCRTRQPVSVDAFAGLQKSKRRNKRGLLLSGEKRAVIAQEFGMTVKDINRNIELIGYFHRERNETLMELHLNECRHQFGSKMLSCDPATHASHKHTKPASTTSSSKSGRTFASLNTFAC